MLRVDQKERPQLDITCGMCFDNRHYRCRGCACSICNNEKAPKVRKSRSGSPSREARGPRPALTTLTDGQQAQILRLGKTDMPIVDIVRSLSDPDVTYRKVHRFLITQGVRACVSPSQRGSSLPPEVQKEALRLLATGLTPGQVGKQLGVGRDKIRTVKNRSLGLDANGKKFKTMPPVVE